MTTATTVSPTRREPQLLGQTLVVIGGGFGIGLETARRARAEGVRPSGRHMIRDAHGRPSSLQLSASICERRHTGTPVCLYSHTT